MPFMPMREDKTLPPALDQQIPPMELSQPPGPQVTLMILSAHTSLQLDQPGHEQGHRGSQFPISPSIRGDSILEPEQRELTVRKRSISELLTSSACSMTASISSAGTLANTSQFWEAKRVKETNSLGLKEKELGSSQESPPSYMTNPSLSSLRDALPRQMWQVPPTPSASISNYWGIFDTPPSTLEGSQPTSKLMMSASGAVASTEGAHGEDHSSIPLGDVHAGKAEGVDVPAALASPSAPDSLCPEEGSPAVVSSKCSEQCPYNHDHGRHGSQPTCVPKIRRMGHATLCWACNKGNHPASSCPNPGGWIWCHLCGWKGFKITTCPQCSVHRRRNQYPDGYRANKDPKKN